MVCFCLFLISGLSIYLFLITIMYCFKENNVITTIALQYLNDIKTIPNFLCAIFISLFFLELTPHNNKIINFISKPTFGIYIIHQVPALIPTLWFGLFRVSEFYNFEYFILYLIIVVFLVYIFGAIIDYIRNKFIEPIWINTSLFNKLCILIDNFYK